MVRFLHLADVHLGYDRYDCPERTKDFFLALDDALERYAIAEQVDFVLIAGDLFEQRQVLPAVLNQAHICLDKLREAGIPVLAIEGNHDHRPYGTRTSWLRYLADWEKLILLEPDEEQSELDPWTPETKAGGYVDLDCGVRVIGSRWYGAMAPQAIQQLAQAIQQLPQGPEWTVMMLHHGLEGQIARYAGALRYQDLLPLQQAGVDYLGLGHIHRNYTAEGWIFNPGSVEANSISENQAQSPRGVYLVELLPSGLQATLKQDYYQRPILRLQLTADSRQTAAELEQEAIAQVQAVAASGETHNAIVELRINGTVSFDRLELNVKALRSQLQQLSQALIFLLKVDVTGTEYHTPLSNSDQPPTRLEIEQSVFTDFLSANVRYQDQASQLATGLMDLKTRVLEQQSEADLYEFVQGLLTNAAPSA